MDARDIANMLLNESYEINEMAAKTVEVKFPLKLKLNVVESAKAFVKKELSKLTQEQFDDKLEYIKDMGQWEGYLKAKNKEELIKIAFGELERYDLKKWESVKVDAAGYIEFGTKEQFVNNLGDCFYAISLQIEEDLTLDLGNSKIKKLKSFSRMVKPKNVDFYYKIFKSAPSAYGEIVETKGEI
jgi:hypothetical protein